MSRSPLIAGLALVSACLVSVQHSQAASAVPARLEAAQFDPAVGWHLRRGIVHACPGVSASRCTQVTSTASTTRWRDCLNCLPHRTVAGMSWGGIGIQITLAVEHPIRARPTFAWPPHISGRTVQAGFEGLPGRIGVYQGQTRVGTHEVFVFVVFGRAVPTRRQLNRANAELQRARLA